MKKHSSQTGKSSPRPEERNPDDLPPSSTHNHGSHGVHDHKRFPTAEELKAFLGNEFLETVDTELALLAYERHLERIAHSQVHPDPGTAFHQVSDGTHIHSATEREPTPRFIIEAILAAVRRRRENHRTFDPAAQNLFNRAVQKAHQAGTYQPFAAIHTNMAVHRMHSMTGAIGTQRFLPWHRQYTLEFENLLRSYEPSVRIPYWDYVTDHARPDWVWLPPTVTRGTPGPNSLLPTPQILAQIQNEMTFTGFTFAVEVDAHNGVHNWCNGTITAPPTAAYDPIFWLLHANVDRIWHLWQLTHNGRPSLKAMDWILDPFAIPASDVDSIIDLGYTYR